MRSWKNFLRRNSASAVRGKIRDKERKEFLLHHFPPQKIPGRQESVSDPQKSRPETGGFSSFKNLDGDCWFRKKPVAFPLG